MTNTYADLSMLKAPGALDITGDSYDSRLLALLEAASRWIDGYCNRRFYVLETTRRFGGGGPELLTPDLARVDRLRTGGADGVSGSEWAASDYRLEPANAEPGQPWGGPYRRVVAAGRLAGLGGFPSGPSRVEITGCWGYREVWQDSGARLQPGMVLSAGAGSLAVTSGDGLAAGQTLRLNGEQVYLVGVAGSSLAVRRGVNGTAAASHLGGSALSVFVYPAAVAEACLLLAARAWQRRGSGRGSNGSEAAGLCRPPDADVRGLLAPYRRLALGDAG